jgi:hypothetical protein
MNTKPDTKAIITERKPIKLILIILVCFALYDIKSVINAPIRRIIPSKKCARRTGYSLKSGKY